MGKNSLMGAESWTRQHLIEEKIQALNFSIQIVYGNVLAA